MKIKLLIINLALIALVFFLVNITLAQDDAVISEIQTDVTVTKSKAAKNEAEIENLKGGLPAERAAREAEDIILHDRIDNIQLTPGPAGPQGEQGPQGTQGDPGVDGINGLSCWDLDDDDTCDGNEDVNTDGVCDALDCQGPQGPPGSEGAIEDVKLELCTLYSVLGNINLGIEIQLPTLCYDCPNYNIEPLEQCDDGNTIDGDGCSSDCFLEACGNGRIDINEECDDGNLDDGDGCTFSCTIEYKTVFITSETYNGNLGGLDGADAKCNNLASSAGLEGEYKAWLSDSSTSVLDRFSRGGAYLATGGWQTDSEGNIILITIADSWADLTDGTIDNRISFDESGQYIGTNYSVWTNTDSNGNSIYLNNIYWTCGDWTDGLTSTSAFYGLNSYTNSSWTRYSNYPCTDQKRLYCFEQ